jgi:hypothetical protein
VRFSLFLLLPALLLAAPVSSRLTSVTNNEATATVEHAQPGLSGVVVRHFDDAHRSIIAGARVTAYDAVTQTAILELSPYDGLEQNALPEGMWAPRAGDTLVLAPDYSRGLLIAGSMEQYRQISKALANIQWVHPDRFAAHLNIEGHPSPTAEDFETFCRDNSIGLLYVHLDDTLLTMDCRSMTLLQQTDAPVAGETAMHPFYSRVERIREAWWGEGSSEMDTYAPYYLELVGAYNPDDAGLQALIERHKAD